jgi:putative ABC transport system permease protein
MLLKIAWRNLLRNLGRTLLTVLGAACALLTFVMLRTVVSSWNSGAEYAAKDRLGTRHKVSFVIQLPKKYIDDIRGVPGVKQATYANWFGARDPRQPNEFFANMAVDAPSFLEVMDELVLPEDQKKAWLEDKKGAIVGDALAKKLGVKVGDKITLEGSIYPGDWEFNIRGIYTASRRSLDRSQFLFHWAYMNDSLPEARRDEIGWAMIRVSNVAQSPQIAQSIDKVFEDRDTQTVTMSERQLQASFMAMFSALLKALDIVSVIILAIMMMVLGNTIAMGVRERTREYGVLRAIGFSPWHIRSFVLGEAAVLGLLAGVAGIVLAYPIVDRGLGQWLEENMGGWFPYFRVEPSTMAVTVAIAIGLSALASLLPVLQAGRISVTDALRRVG